MLACTYVRHSFTCCLCGVMALSTNYHLSLSFAVLAIFFFSLTLLPPKSGGMDHTSSINIDEQLKKMVLGSRPPACSVDKCMNCRPCEATLVIPPHRNNDNNKNKNIERGYEKSSRREDDSYYLLSWKCRCGNKFYQP